MHTVIFTGGRFRDGSAVRNALESADAVIAADSGAEAALAMNIIPKAVVGDFDSLARDVHERLRAEGVKLLPYPAEKDRTDTELAIDHAVRQGAGRVTVLGGIEGDRIDHVISNVLIMNAFKAPVRFVNGTSTVWQAKGPRTESIDGSAGDRLSLIPLTPRVSGITTAGLKYRLANGALRMDQARGVSNVMTRKQASVTWSRGALLFVHDANPG